MYKSILEELEHLGTDQNVKIYKRHGAKEPLFGVSFANLKKLTKKYNGDTELSLKLWDSKNMDARVLATMIADPNQIKSSQLDQWVKDTDYTVLAGYMGSLVGKSPFFKAKFTKWHKSNKEFEKDTAFSMISSILKNDPSKLDDELAKYLLEYISSNIHNSANYAKAAMNNCLIALGVYKPKLTKKTISIAKKIGKVEVDHGETNCKTPDAISYIEKTIAHQKKKKVKI